MLVHCWAGEDERPDPAAWTALLAELRRSRRAPVEHVEADFADPDGACGGHGGRRESVRPRRHPRRNHALSRLGALDELTADDLDAHLHVNVRASLLLVKEFAAQHDGRPGGRVVLLTSGQHLAPMTVEVAYAASKGALQQVTATLADALIDRGITVNAVNPGPTDTGWAAGLDASRLPARPLGTARRRGSPDRLALLRRSGVGHRPGDRLRGRLSSLGLT